MRRMRLRLFTGVVSVVIVACSSGQSSSRPKSTVTTTNGLLGHAFQETAVLAKASPYGAILAASFDVTVYVNVHDSPRHSNCAGTCTKTWIPLTVRRSPEVGEGVSASLLGIIRRDDGRKQVTYNGHPLYTYRGDHQPLEAIGQGASGNWYVISASGDPVRGTQ